MCVFKEIIYIVVVLVIIVAHFQHKSTFINCRPNGIFSTRRHIRNIYRCENQPRAALTERVAVSYKTTSEHNATNTLQMCKNLPRILIDNLTRSAQT